MEPANQKVLCYLREYEGQVLLVLINLSRYAQPFDLHLQHFKGWTPVEMFGNTLFPPIGKAPYVMSLAAHGFLWFRLER